MTDWPEAKELCGGFYRDGVCARCGHEDHRLPALKDYTPCFNVTPGRQYDLGFAERVWAESPGPGIPECQADAVRRLFAVFHECGYDDYVRLPEPMDTIVVQCLACAEIMRFTGKTIAAESYGNGITRDVLARRGYPPPSVEDRSDTGRPVSRIGGVTEFKPGAAVCAQGNWLEPWE